MDEYTSKIQWILEDGSEIDQETMKIVREKAKKEQETKEEYQDKLPF